MTDEEKEAEYAKHRKDNYVGRLTEILIAADVSASGLLSRPNEQRINAAMKLAEDYYAELVKRGVTPP